MGTECAEVSVAEDKQVEVSLIASEIIEFSYGIGMLQTPADIVRERDLERYPTPATPTGV